MVALVILDNLDILKGGSEVRFSRAIHLHYAPRFGGDATLRRVWPWCHAPSWAGRHPQELLADAQFLKLRAAAETPECRQALSAQADVLRGALRIKERREFKRVAHRVLRIVPHTIGGDAGESLTIPTYLLRHVSSIIIQ